MESTIDRVETGALAQGTAQVTRDTGAAPHAASDFAITGTDDADAPIPFSVPADAWPIPFALTAAGREVSL